MAVGVVTATGRSNDAPTGVTGTGCVARVRVGRKKGMVEVALARGGAQEDKSIAASSKQVTGIRLISNILD